MTENVKRVDMEALAVRRGFEDLGLQLLLSQVRILAGDDIPASLPPKDVQALEDLQKFLDAAIKGIEITEQRKARPGFGSVVSLSEAVRAERAYRVLHSSLPEDPTDAEKRLRTVRGISSEILQKRSTTPRKRNKLHSFCKVVIARLDRERFEMLADPQSAWP